MAVVNVSVANIRPQYKNLYDWCMDPRNVYIARKGIVFVEDPSTGKKKRFPDYDSPFANPYKIDDAIKLIINTYYLADITANPAYKEILEKNEAVQEYARTIVIENYKDYIIQRLNNEPELLQLLLSYRGKNLGCWCKPKACHGDVLLQIIHHYTAATSI